MLIEILCTIIKGKVKIQNLQYDAARSNKSTKHAHKTNKQTHNIYIHHHHHQYI